ncbi:MAG: translocation/assembly module TamB domain-containing protein [Gemmatimonadetes bacterium]|nr:translocation/assembly module TamB domain-containing protein [Gemmatimonadota bacterium]
MGRRQLLVIVSALAMILIGAGVVSGLVAATQSDGGREWIRAQISREVNRGLRGRFHLGRLSGSFLTDITIDSVSLTGLDDSVYVSSGRISLRYDPRDLVDGRFLFRSIEAEHPFLVMRKDPDGVWNYRKIFPPRNGPLLPVRRARNAFGSLVVATDVRVHGGEVRLTKPWTPDDSLSGARRDSAIAFNLADPTNDIRRVTANGVRGFQKTWRWKDIEGNIARLRFRHPDSTGRHFEIARLDVNETVPPFAIRELHGTALWRGDTVWLDADRFTLPGSVGRMVTKVEWPTGDMYWDARMESDSTALSDLSWISPSIPTVGYGAMKLHVKTRANHNITDYVITEMDVRSGNSRLRGTMTYGVGGPVLEARDVNLSLEPADFVFFEALNTQPFPYPWRGTVTGTVRASGGPVNRFQVEHMELAFADSNVPGATARGTGRGELDILFPGLAKFHSFQLDIDHFDLRTGQFLNPDFPELNGHMGGTATLDSIWTDVRLSNADITHRDGEDSVPSRFRGGGRLTLGDDFVSFDLTTAALPVNATTIARSYPALPLRGEYRGPMRVQGTVADMALSTDLVGDAGRLQLDGQFDALEPGFRAVARGTLSAFDFRRGFGSTLVPSSSFDGRFAVDLAGDSLANLAGTAQLNADRSMVDGVRVFGGLAALRFGNGLMRVDSLSLESAAGSLAVRGALGMIPAVTDTLRFQFAGDSLGGLRRYLARGGSTADSLQGAFSGTGLLTGRTSRFALDASVAGTELLLRTAGARQVRGTVSLSSLPDSATGAVTIRLDGVRSGTMAISSADVRADLLDGWQARTSAQFSAPSGTAARALADVRRRGDTTVIRLDSLSARTATNNWTLERTATLALAGGGFRLDTLVLSGAQGGRIDAAGRTSVLDTIAVALRADGVPLADFGELFQTREPMAGLISLRADVRGTRARPDLFFTGTLNGATVAGLQLERLDADGRYADRRLTAAVSLVRDGKQALHADASLPIDLAFDPVGSRFLEEPLTGHVRTDSASLGLLESFFPVARDARGGLSMDLDVGGTWRHPLFTGSVAISDGSLSLRPMGNVCLEGLEANIGFLGDSIAVRRLEARSGPDLGRTAAVTGWISIRDVTDPAFTLRLSSLGFNVLDDPAVADLDLTGTLQLSGRRSASVLSGGFTVDRGEIRLPELYRKQLISLDDLNQYRLVDTTALVDRRLVAAGDSVFMNNLALRDVRIRMGSDVWLRSAEANINLGGSVLVTRNRVAGGANAGRSQLALDGALQTVRGTYRLNLGLVQRTFTVESGEVRFFGDADLNAALNINAFHVVRQVSKQGARPDVRVQVHIGGTRLSPTAELSTPDSVLVTTADLISYLTTGGPSSDISGRGGDYYGSTAARLFLTTAGSFLGAKVPVGICDDAQLLITGLDGYQGALRSVSGQVLQGTRFNCAKQITDNLFVRLDAGLCQVGKFVDPNGTSSGPLQLADAFGVKLDWRMAADFTVSVGLEPPTSAVFCRDDVSARGFAPTPRQIGFDLFRLWRF